ncbi:MAG: molybdenum cofactor guanylyltransferase [Myxococcaceae bacterium]
MPPRWPDASLAILAGGAGTRLGSVPKGLLRLQGRTFLDRLLDLQPAFGETFLVATESASYAGLGVRAIPDVIENAGAPGGVHAALTQAKSPWVFVAAVDLPMLTLPVVAQLALQLDDSVDVVCYSTGRRFEPLAAFYRSSLAQQLEPKVRSGASLQELIAGVRVRALDERELRRVDASGQALMNVNTPEDLQRVGGARPAGR